MAKTATIPGTPGWRIAGGTLGGLLLIGFLLPARPAVTRSIGVDAPAATVFALVNDPAWIDEWSVRLDDDPNARREYNGVRRGVGAALAWQGTIAGSGSEAIVESEPWRRVATRIDTGDGRETTATYVLGESPSGTNLEWTLARNYGFNLPGRYFGFWYRRLAAREMEEGLARLKSIAESLPGADFAGLDVEQLEEAGQEIAYRRATSFPEASAIAAALADAYFDILGFIDRYGLQQAGAPLSISRSFSGAELVFDAAIPVRGIREDTPAQDGFVSLGATYEGPVVRARHVGAYSTLSATHESTVAYLAAMRLVRNGDAWEEYVSDPTETPEAELVTYVYYPVEGD